MRSIMVIAVAVFTLSPRVGLSQDTNYSHKADLPPLRVAYDDLQPVISKAATLIRQANVGANSKTLIENVKIGSQASSLEIQGHSFTSEMRRLPRKPHSFEFRYVSSGSAPVSGVTISLRDYDRTLTVSGSSPEQVDALFSALREELEAISTPVGGDVQKFILGFVLLVILIVFTLEGLAFMIQTRTLEHWWVPTLCAVMFGVMFFSPLHELLDGFLLVATDPSFLVRYGPEIALVGLLVGIAPLLLRLFMSKKDVNRPDKQPPNPPLQEKPRKRRS